MIVKVEGKINGVGALHESASRGGQGPKEAELPEGDLRCDQCGVLKPPSYIQAEGFPTEGHDFEDQINRAGALHNSGHGELKAASSRRTPRRAAPANVQTLWHG